MFQSQTRSQSPGDNSHDAGSKCIPSMFQSQTRSQSPGDSGCRGKATNLWHGFNRRREANPLATQVVEERPQTFGTVSIADAKPIPWRPPIDDPAEYANSLFQSQTRSQSPGDVMIMGCRASTFASFNRRREA